MESKTIFSKYKTKKMRLYSLTAHLIEIGFLKGTLPVDYEQDIDNEITKIDLSDKNEILNKKLKILDNKILFLEKLIDFSDYKP